MAGGIGQYFKDTRVELNHVAWPTQSQTVIYTILVAAISIGVAAYLGLFDFFFTTALARVAGVAAHPAGTASGIQVTQQPAAAQSSGTQAPAISGPVFNVVPGGVQTTGTQKK